MKLFREDNTEGYTDEQMDALNTEWKALAEAEELEEGTYDYNQAAKQFCDEVSRR